MHIIKSKQKIWKLWENVGSWCWVCLIFNCFYFIRVISTFNSASCVFCDDEFISRALLYLVKVLIFPIPWVKVWHIQFAWIVIKLQQSIRLKSSQNNLDNPDNTTMLHWAFFTNFDFESVLSSNTHSWVADIYYS